MKKILVTGSNGQLGSDLRDISENFDFEFIFTDYKELDITNILQLEGFFKKNKFHYLINCAAYTAVDKAETDTENAELLNTIAPGYLAAFSKAHGIKLVHISTDYVFDGKNFIPYKENDETNPSSVYGVTKLEGENNIISENPDSIIIRTSWLYSSHGNNFVKTMLKLSESKNSLNIIFDQIGTPTYSRELANVIMRIISLSEKKSSYFVAGVYHYSNEGVCSWYDFAKEIFSLKKIKCLTYPIETKDYPTPASRPHYSILNKSKIKETFSLTIPHWKDSLKDCLDLL